MPMAMGTRVAKLPMVRRAIVRERRRVRGRIRCCSVVKMLKVCWMARTMARTTMMTQMAIVPPEDQVHVDPEKVAAIWKSVKRRTLSIAPSQSSWASFSLMLSFGFGRWTG